jgi:hypothetical protein
VLQAHLVTNNVSHETVLIRIISLLITFLSQSNSSKVHTIQAMNICQSHSLNVIVVSFSHKAEARKLEVLLSNVILVVSKSYTNFSFVF